MEAKSGSPPYQQICAETQWMPSVAFMALWQELDVPWLMEACENYQKRSWRNRAYIPTPQGIQMLSVPLDKGKNRQMNIQEVTINYNEDWPRQHIHALRTAYGSAPFYEHYMPEIGDIYDRQFKTLWEWNLVWINWFKQKLYLERDVIFTKKFEKEKAEDILDLRNLPKRLEKAGGLTVSKHFWYPQLFESETGFKKEVSIIDLLFCTGPEAGTFLSQYWQYKNEHG